MNDPMRGTRQEREAYLAKINDMIQQDIEERKAARLDEFKRTRDSRGVLVGGQGMSNNLVNAVPE